jgi:hypothetical protein
MKPKLALLSFAAFVLACETQAEIPWEIRVSNSELSERIAVFETSIWRGGCDGVLVYEALISRDQSGPSPALGRGLHGFRAEARDASCVVVARGCVEYDMPLGPEERVVLMLEPVELSTVCPPSMCSSGVCSARDSVAENDGSMPDHAEGLDAGMLDVGTSTLDAETLTDGGFLLDVGTHDAGRRPRGGGSQ